MPRNGHWVQNGSGGRQISPAGLMGIPGSQNKPGLWPPSHVCPAEVWRGLGTTWVLLPVVGRTQLSGEGLALHLGCS